MRSNSYIFLLVVLVLGGLAGFGYKKLGYHMGLDTSGGIRLTYQMDLSTLPKDSKEKPATIQSNLVNIMENRAAGSLAVSEPEVTSKGDDQIVVELPGYSNLAQAEEVMGSSARIEFYWAKSVTTKLQADRPYIAEDSKDPNEIGVNFRERITGKEITPKDPEYKAIIAGWEPPILGGDELAKAAPANTGGNYDPEMTFTAEGATKMDAWSRAHVNQGENLAAVLDGKVLSIAAVRDNTILSDNAVIEGTFPEGYTAKLCDLLNSGSLPVNLNLLGAEKVDATIGAQALQKIIQAGFAAFAVISIFLIGYYAFPGIVAFLALSLYVLFTLTVLKLINATFSLAGIAGFILSVGMAVDANILVFERFKEEMAAGRTLAKAIDLGFRRALPAIIDSNACTVITSLVLVQLGTGPVKGFATTLIIGVLISLFTAVTVTRSLLMFFVGSGIATNPSWYAVSRNWFSRWFAKHEGQSLNVVRKAKLWFAASAITVVVCIPFFFPPLSGFRLNVEFQGGYETVVSLAGSQLTGPQMEGNLEKAGLTGGNVQLGEVGATATAPAHRVAYISLPRQANLAEATGPDSSKVDEQNAAKIAQAAGLQPDPNAEIQKIGPALQAETRNNAILGVIVSSCLIIVYLAIRFGTGFGGFTAGMRFGLSAIGALIHDILVVFGTAAVVGYFGHWEVSALFLTAMLTIIGFSVHDTIVIFDRIRENLRHSKKTEDFGDLMDRSITQSFARSINTSGTVIVTLLILVFFGTVTNDLKFFVTSMLIGIISGTYSSIYNASPILYLWDRAIEKKKGHQASLVGLVAQEVSRQAVFNPTAVASPQGQAQAPQSTSGTSGRSYGQVRRRANSPKNQGIELDD